MEKLILDQFLINACILCTLLFLFHQLHRKINLSKNSSIRLRIFAGLLQGGFGSLLMHYGIHLPGGTLIDLRSIPIMVAAQMGGGVSAVIAALVIVAVRYFFYPYSASTVLNVFVLLAAGIAFGLISRMRVKRNTQWRLMTMFFVLDIGATIWIILSDVKSTVAILVQYSIAIVFGSFVAQLLLSVLSKSEDNLETLNRQAQTDFLTGLHNARSFNQELRAAFQRAVDRREPLSLLAVDIDRFKSINDTYGHPAGDEVLKQVGWILEQSCRSVDIVSRNGGEEFSVILPACDRRVARLIAERIRKTVENKAFGDFCERSIQVTVSIGIATVTDFEQDDWERLVKLADERLYAAKRTGRNRVCFQ